MTAKLDAEEVFEVTEVQKVRPASPHLQSGKRKRQEGASILVGGAASE